MGPEARTNVIAHVMSDFHIEAGLLTHFTSQRIRGLLAGLHAPTGQFPTPDITSNRQKDLLAPLRISQGECLGYYER